MIKVLDWASRAGLPGGAARRFVRVAALLSMSFAHVSAHKQSLDYLPRVGPAPLRFQAEGTQLKPLVLPPLNMGIRTREIPMNGPSALSPTNQATAAPIHSPVTNQIAKIPAEAPALPFQLPRAPLPASPPLDAAAQLLASPVPANESVLTPQMFVHFFQKNGTNGGASVTVPIDATRPESPARQSSATYVSP